MSCILIIDDDELVSVSLAKIFRNAGYETVTASDGVKGMAALKDNNIDIIVTDLIMPEKDGLEVIKEVKDLSPVTPIIAISGGGRFKDPDLYLTSAKEFGAVTVLSKPFSIKTLLDAVEDGLQNKSGSE